MDYPWTVVELAARAYLSPSHLHRVMLQHEGRNPMEMLRILRIRRAQHQLVSTDRTVEEIAMRVGYSTPFALSKAFKRITGLSPSAYRKAHGQE
jgi:AraC-like DNA-binding protein